MNILHIRASNFYGGPERQIHYHVRRSPHNQTVASYAESGDPPQFLQVLADDGVATHLFEVRSAYDRNTARLIRDYLNERQIDIFCTHDYRSHFWGFRAARGSSARWLVFSRGFTRDSLRVRFYGLIERYVTRHADRVVAVSLAQKKKLERWFIPESKIAVVHNCVIPAEFESIPKVDLREQFGWSNDCVICVSGGRFSREKGQFDLVCAAATALEKQPNLRFVVIGDGPELTRVRDYLKQRGLEDKIVCPGHRRDIIGWLKGADILINPSHTEGLPNIVLEAMAVKLPVIATAVGGVPELIEDNRNGCLIAPRKVTPMADTIVALAGDPEKRTRLADAAFDTIVQDFGSDSHNRKLNDIYAQLI